MLQLRRITSGGRFIPEMDGFRFAAIATVVLFHYWGYAGSPSTWGVDWVARHGYRGVNLFYVISGFVLGLPFAAWHLSGGPAVPLKRYFLRRLTRLEPPYLLNLLICAVVGGVTWTHMAASAVYLHSQIFGEKSLVNPVTWSLEVEVQFYCLAPVLAGLFRVPGRMARRGVLAGLMLGLGLAQLAFWGAPARVLYSIAFALQYFLAGFLLADLFLVDWREAPPRHWGVGSGFRGALAGDPATRRSRHLGGAAVPDAGGVCGGVPGCRVPGAVPAWMDHHDRGDVLHDLPVALRDD